MRVPRDTEYERSMLEEAGRLAELPAASPFVERVMGNLDERGPDFRVLTPEELLVVLERSAENLVEWAVLGAQSLAARAFAIDSPETAAELLGLVRAVAVAGAGLAQLIDPVPGTSS